MDSSKLDEQVSLIGDLNLIKDSWIIKVCVVRLLKQADFKNPSQTYSIELVLVDEAGTRIQANVQKRCVDMFQHRLKEGSFFYIKDFGIANNTSRFKYCNHPYKLNLYGKTKVMNCTNFIGSVYGFELSDFQLLWARGFTEHVTIDVIGDVVTCGVLDINPESKQRKVQLEIQDLNGVKLYVTLWDQYADEMNEYVKSHTLRGRVIIILQFATVKWYSERQRPYVSSCYSFSKLHINAEIDEITNFKTRLLADHGDDSSHQVSIVTRKSYSIHDDFLVHNERKDIVELFEIVKTTTCIIVGTIKFIPKDQEWYYLGCKICTSKVRAHYLISDKQDESCQIEEKHVFKCDKCKETVTDVTPRFRIPIRVQDSTGVVTLTLFDRDAKKILNKSVYDLLDKNEENADIDYFPEELNDLLERKFAFKIEITDWNLNNNKNVYGISKLTNDAQIILQLEHQTNVNQDTESGSLTIGISDTQPQQECLKDAISYTGEAATPSNVEKSTASVLSEKNKLNKFNCTPVELKRKLDEVYSQDDDDASGSTTKSATTATDVNKPTSKKADVMKICNIKLLSPKKEK